MHGTIDVEDLHEKASNGDMKKIEKKTYAFILLNLSNKILREVSKETTFEKVLFKLIPLILINMCSIMLFETLFLLFKNGHVKRF